METIINFVINQSGKVFSVLILVVMETIINNLFFNKLRNNIFYINLYLFDISLYTLNTSFFRKSPCFFMSNTGILKLHHL